ncbi:MAG TPA: cytochrome c maturation protein CcmE [Limnochordales bacterium]
MRNPRLLAALVVGSAVLYLMAMGFTRTAPYYLTVSEIQVRAGSLQDKPLRVAGVLVGDSIQWDVQNFFLRFAITDGQETLTAEYRGVRPDNFEGGKQVIVEGRLRPDGVFVANQVMVQCPSRYEAEKDGGGL